MEITITLDSQSDEVSLSLSTKITQDIQFSPVSDKIILGVSDFPNYKNIFPETIFAPLQSSVSVRAVTSTLISDVDPNTVVSMDNMSVKVLDIKKDVQIKNIN